MLLAVKARRMLKSPYLLFLGNTTDPSYAKTAFGLRDWVPERCAGQLRLGAAVDLGLEDLSLEEAAAKGVATLVIGVAPPGGQLPAAWVSTIVAALNLGLDVASGLHTRLSQINEIATAAELNAACLHDVRVPREDYPVANGKRRTGKRLLTVGTDCAVGKKYAALSIFRSMQESGIKSSFRATGQTGILLSGDGVPVDSVIADFISGAAEVLSPDNDADHWDVIEGQGSLFHPAYAGVTTGLIHGSQPDALLLCDEAGKEEIYGYPGFKIPSLKKAMSVYQDVARLTNPDASFVGVAINTASMSEDDALQWLARNSTELELPCVDPFRFGVEPLMSQFMS